MMLYEPDNNPYLRFQNAVVNLWNAIATAWLQPVTNWLAHPHTMAVSRWIITYVFCLVVVATVGAGYLALFQRAFMR